MSQELGTLPAKLAKNNVTIIQVDKDISFVLDTRDVNYGVPLSLDKSAVLSRKTYSKKHPVTYNPCVSYSDDSISVISSTSSTRSRKATLKHSPKCENSIQSPIKGKPGRKRLADSDTDIPDCPIHKRGKKQGPVARVSPTKINGCITTNNFKSKSVRELQNERETSPDSDVEIVEIVQQSTSRTVTDVYRSNPPDCRNGDVSRRKNQQIAILKPSTSYSSNEDVPITEANTAPFMPSYSVMPALNVDKSNCGMQSSMKWLSANGTLSFSPIQNGGACGAKDPALQFNDKFHLYLPEMKLPHNEGAPGKKEKGKRELKGLYENLNEISWANEKSFKQLLSTNVDNRHSGRITAKVNGSLKNLRRLNNETLDKLSKQTSSKQKPGLCRKTSTNLTLNRAKYGVVKPSLLVKTVPKQKVPFNKVSKITKSTLKPKKINGTKTVSKPNKARVVKTSVLKTSKGKVIKKSVIKSNKVNVKKTVVKPDTTNITKSIIKSNVTKPVIKSEFIKSVIKPSKSILKPTKSLKVRFKDLETKIGPKDKASSVDKDKDKDKSLVAAVASSSKNIDTFSDSFQNSAGNCSHSADNSLFSAFGKNMLRNENFSDFKNSSFVKELQKYDVSNEFQMLKHASSDKVLETAVKKGSKLRVTVEPLEHTKLWNADFFEAFKKHVLEQAFLQTFERRDQESISNMFQELQEACFHPPNSMKSLKKKKTTEDEVPRSSVRQIEKGFGYKEIFVKKMDNYLQFVLMPNACKLNSLNIEAIKELKEAFIQAKKDPSCRAVLLNSSGTYFCTGIELSLLVGSSRKQSAEEMASSIRDLILTLSTFTKPIIAAVNGTAVGLGVAILTYCDVVLASDKATFCIPATRLGYLPEGGITLTLPQVVGSGVATEMLLYGRRLTAEQALRHGLVSEVLWPTQLMNEVVPRMKTICSQPLQVMEATKTMVRCHLWDKLKTHMEREWRLLPPLWLDAQCQHNIKRTLSTGWLVD